MATPESNALLAMQLMGAPFAQYNQQNDARTNLAFKLAAMQREEQLKRDLLAQQDERAFKLAEMQAGREDKRNQATIDWHKTDADARERGANARATESERKQNAALDARDKQQVTAEMNRLYPQYAQAAARAGEKIKQRNEYPETNEGLGQLAADARTAEVGFDEKKQKGAAMALVGGLDEAVTAVDAIKSRISELAKPLPQELKVARTQAVKALQAAIENKQLASAEKLRPAAIKKGLAHLAAGEDALARELLGAEAFTAFENAIETTLLGLDSRKSAMQERSQLNQQLLQLQSQASRTNSDVVKAAAGNPFLADELATRRTSIQRLMTPIEEPKRQRSFEDVTPARGAPGATEPSVIPPPRPNVGAVGIGAPPTNLFSLMQTGATPTRQITSLAPSTPDRAPYSFGQEIRNNLGLPPLTRDGYAFDLQKLNDQLRYQNERGQATTLQDLQRLLLRATTDPALAPSN